MRGRVSVFGRMSAAWRCSPIAAALLGCLLISVAGCARPVAEAAPTPAFAVVPPTAGLVEAWVGTPEEIRSTEVKTVYRVWGGTARQLGAWMSPVPPTSAAVVRADMALPPQNTAEFWCVVTVPAGTRMRIGIAAPAFDQPGGGRQIELLEFIPVTSFGEPQPLAP